MESADLRLLRWPSSPTLSPDGRRIAFAVHRVDVDADGYRSDLWVVPADGSAPAMQLTRGGFDSLPTWSPDGGWIAFRRGGEDLPGQLHVLPVDGGEARPVTSHPLGVEEIVWSPDGSAIAYTARVPEAGRYEKGEGARPAGKEAPRRIDRLRYRRDGTGFLLDRPVHLFVVRPHADEPVALKLTEVDWGFSHPTWTADGATVLVTTDHVDDELSMAGDIYAIPAGGGELRRITRSTTGVGPLSIGADERWVYYLGGDLGSRPFDVAGRSTSLFSVPFDGSAEPVRLTDPDLWDLSDLHVNNALVRHGEHLWALVGWRGSVEAVRIRPGSSGTGELVEPELVGASRHVVCEVDVASETGTVAGVVATAGSAGEIAVLGEGGWDVITDLGHELAVAAAVLPMQEIEGRAADGYPVHGWVVKPAGEGPHPVLLVIHGGPATQYGYRLFDEAQVYASAGYAVVMGNPRGSSGYGQAHARAIVGDMGNLDQADLLALLDRALEDPSLDGGRVGVMGGSYGGFMTTWLAAHHGQRFRAAISERALNAWDSFVGSSDIGWYFAEAYCGADPKVMDAQSPLAYADSIDIPMLLIHSEQDWRCPIEQAQRLFVALKRRGVVTEMLIFPGEGHELSRSGLPSHRMARFEAILEWWARHL